MASRSKRKKPAPAAPKSKPKPASSYTLPCLLLVAGVFLLYAGSYRYPPVFDDKLLNPVDLPGLASFCVPLSFRCLSYTTFGATYLVAGLNPFWFHVGNVLCHALAALACFVFLDKLFAAARHGTADAANATLQARGRRLAFCGAVIFAVHPITVYGAAYLTQRSTVLATLFSLLALGAFVQGMAPANTRPWRWFGLAAALYIAALLSKEHAIMLPALALAIAVLLGKKLPESRRDRWLLLAGTLAIAGVLVVTAFSRKDVIGSAYEPYVRELSALREAGAITLDPSNAYAVSLVTQAWLYFKYLLLWLAPWPGWLSVDMRQPIPDSPLAWPHVLAIPAFAAYGLIAFLLLRRRGTTGLLGLALLFSWLMFFTEFATARIQEPFVLYRSYLWMPGLAAALPFVTQRLSVRQITIACVVVAMVFGIAMRERLATFESNLSLWDDVVRKNTDTTLIFSDRGYGNRAVALLRENRLDEALRDLDTTLRLNPQNAHAWVNRGTVLSRRGEMDKALADIDRAIALDPNFAEAHAERCSLLIKSEQPIPALESCTRALRIAPYLPNARINRAVLHARAMRMPEAIDDLDHVIRLEPGHGIALYNRGMMLRQMNRLEEANKDLRAACAAGFAPACSAPR